MEEKNSKKISLSDILLILALIVIAVMSFFIFKLYKDKAAATEAIKVLNNEIALLQNSEALNVKDSKENTDTINVKIEYKNAPYGDAKIIDKFLINNNNVIDSMLSKTHYEDLQLVSKETNDNLVFANVRLYGSQFDEKYLFIYNNNAKLINYFHLLDYDEHNYKYDGTFEYASNKKALSFSTYLWLGEGELSTGGAFGDKTIDELSKSEMETFLNTPNTIKYNYKYENGKFELAEKKVLTKLKDDADYVSFIKGVNSVK